VVFARGDSTSVSRARYAALPLEIFLVLCIQQLGVFFGHSGSLALFDTTEH
jgi:hypothetical protein